MKKGNIIVIFLIFLLFFIFLTNNINTQRLDNANVFLLIEDVPRIIVYHPENTTYITGNIGEYVLDLNVSLIGSFVPDTWWYRLLNITPGGDVVINDSVIFNPNTTINPVVGVNRIVVYVNNSIGEIVSNSVVFTVRVNTAPLLGYIPENIYVCENTRLYYGINATDLEADPLDFYINPRNPFFISPESFPGGLITVFTNITSINLTKQYVSNHPINISVSDGEFSDWKLTNVVVIPVNNPPVMEIVGVQTVWSRGENSTFYKQVMVSDTEDGNQNSGNLTFNLTWHNGENLFSINQFGIMNHTANESEVGVYNLTVCVTDRGLSLLHPNSSICGETGAPKQICQNFSLTITDENRPPTIIDHYPKNYSLVVSEGEPVYFNVTNYDPDGTIPDVYWYVDNLLRQYTNFNLSDEFTYIFPYGSAGEHFVSVNITDGEFNDSLRWNITVLYVPRPPPVGAGGGGGGTGCIPEWVCTYWGRCILIEEGLKKGAIVRDTYRILTENCTLSEILQEFCGYQTRGCVDFNNCGTNISRPEILRMCYYGGEGNCSDGIKNCHSGSCEVGIDCGGPCPPCPTCSDGIMNCHRTLDGKIICEEGIDCGGPCPAKCERFEPKKEDNLIWYVLITISVVLIVIFTIRMIKMTRQYMIIKKRKEREEEIK